MSHNYPSMNKKQLSLKFSNNRQNNLIMIMMKKMKIIDQKIFMKIITDQNISILTLQKIGKIKEK